MYRLLGTYVVTVIKFRIKKKGNKNVSGTIYFKYDVENLF